MGHGCASSSWGYDKFPGSRRLIVFRDNEDGWNIQMENIARGMSRMRRRKGMALQVRASVFAALGDETRLAVLAKLCKSEPQSISRLTEGSKLSRQAVTKHLRVLEGAGVVRCVRAGRESSLRVQARAN